MSKRNKPFITRQEFCTTAYWKVVFGSYGSSGWLLKDVFPDSPLDVTKFKEMAQEVEEILIKLNKKGKK